MKYLFFFKRNYISLRVSLQKSKHPCNGIWKGTPEIQGENTDSHPQATRFAHSNSSLKKYNYSIWICNS